MLHFSRPPSLFFFFSLLSLILFYLLYYNYNSAMLHPCPFLCTQPFHTLPNFSRLMHHWSNPPFYNRSQTISTTVPYSFLLSPLIILQHLSLIFTLSLSLTIFHHFIHSYPPTNTVLLFSLLLIHIFEVHLNTLSPTFVS